MSDSFYGQTIFFNNIINFTNNGKVSHAYLVETNNCVDKEKIISQFIRILYYSKFNDINENIMDNLPTIEEMVANGNYLEIGTNDSIIKKDQVLEIQEKFMTKSWDDKYRIYVIYNADKLNKQAANSLLKFLEEPEDDIIAILVSDNRYQVLETIRSRCQILSLISNKVEIEFEDMDLIYDIIQTLETKKEASIAYFPIVCNNEYYSIQKWVNIFSTLMLIYEQALRKLSKIDYSNKFDEIIDCIMKYNDLNSILKKIDVLSKQIDKLKFNLNINLMLDNFIISFTGGDSYA